MELLGYVASLFIGISLGLIGGGGSILTVPVLAYMFGLQPLLATSYSLFIVGTTSLAGALTHWRQGGVNIKAAALFGISSIVTVFITRKYLLPAVPQNLFSVGSVTVTSAAFTMVLFAGLMLLASAHMIWDKSHPRQPETYRKGRHFAQLFLYGVSIGLVTGLLGAGGGFLLMPALVLLLKLPMKKAIGTSLLIIALNSLIGFAGDLDHISIDWAFLLRITALAIAGIILGGVMAKKIAGESLKRGFGWFILAMGIYILLKETVVG